MNVLVTGATGFVGSRLLQLLLKQNETVTAVYRKQIDEYSPNVKGPLHWENTHLSVFYIQQ